VCLQAVYRAVVPSHAATKRDIRFGNSLNIVSNLCVMVDVQETSNCVTSLICHAPVLFIILIDSSNKDKQF
jgi:hypothetical protein